MFGNRVGSITRCFYRVICLTYLEDPECYTGGSVATGRVSLARQDEGESSDEDRYPGPPG